MSEGRAAQTPLYWSWWGWEPVDHYRRLGSNVGAVDGSALWLDEWYDRLHSEEIVQKMADLGVNLAVTHFFKGFGLAQEREEEERTRELVEIAHRHGIRVLGYCQNRSIYYEAFLSERDDAAAWIQRDEKGRLRTWGGSYFRWSPCIMSRAFRKYLKKVIAFGLEHVGLDGFHFDNDYAEPCYCETCEKAFRTWLTRRFPEPRDLFGLATFDHVRQPPTRRDPAIIQDPIERAWVRFRCELLGAYHLEITEHARSIRPDVLLCANPAHPRRPSMTYSHSVWAPLVGRHLDVMFAENGNFAALDNGVVTSQVRAYKQAEALGYRVLSTTWKRTGEQASSLPQAPESIGLQIAEAAANNGVPGTNWALRALGKGDGMRIDLAELKEPFARYLGFVRAHEDIFQGATPLSEVAVLYTYPSLVYDTAYASAQLLGTEEVLIRAGFTWNVLFEEDLDRLDDFAVVVVAGQTNLSDRLCDRVRAFVRDGGGLVLVGQNGTRDEYGRTRAVEALRDLKDDRVERLDAGVVETEIEAGHGVRVSLPSRWNELACAVVRVAGGVPTVRVRGSDTVALSAYEHPEEGWVIHLVNYAAPSECDGVYLELGIRQGDVSRARILTPEGAEAPLEMKSDGERISIPIPRFPVYAIVLVK